ncbi:hypothetical protein DSL64_11810 [Dyadobacter luteus]|jgi:O-antigen/teichoic acid export membrane protein|uniref:Uncharacterized protein n=1 Tax=Dyadobacter luteus TaxID=2259619 RepID=A0A3D8YBV8_9BACT|nr:hypothetical protein [Dyadobacter luteus]REA61642.1 hypothetical protein DSL64_11810 [Dyadobacter luteus]
MLRSILATLILGIVLFLAPYIGLDSYLHPYIWYILAFFLGISFLIHRLMEFGLQNNKEKFVSFYISTIVAKLILSLIFIGIFLYKGLSDSFLFVINFFALYLFYTCFEIYGLYRNLRRD